MCVYIYIYIYIYNICHRISARGSRLAESGDLCSRNLAYVIGSVRVHLSKGPLENKHGSAVRERERERCNIYMSMYIYIYREREREIYISLYLCIYLSLYIYLPLHFRPWPAPTSASCKCIRRQSIGRVRDLADRGMY